MGIDLWIGKLSCPSLETLRFFLFATFPFTSQVTLDGAEQSSFVRGNGEQLLQRITATPLPGWDRISIALMSYQA